MNTGSPTLTESGDGRWRALARFGLTQWPYLLMYALAVIGVAWTSRHPEASGLYWEILAPIFALICVAARWPDPADWRSRRRLLWEQALHWGVFVLTMQLLFLPDVQQMIDSDVIGLFVLYLLGMATFLPGVYYSIWQLCLVGVGLVLSVPAIASVEQSVLLILLLVFVIASVGATVLWFRRRGGRE